MDYFVESMPHYIDDQPLEGQVDVPSHSGNLTKPKVFTYRTYLSCHWVFATVTANCWGSVLFTNTFNRVVKN